MKVLFLIHDLGQGGAEKVLVNLVNNMDRKKFDISVIALFGGGVNEQFLAPDIHYRAVFPREIPGNSKIMKLLTPEQLHRLCVKDKYDIEISYLEGPSARVISGCKNANTKLVSWIHSKQYSMKNLSKSFRNSKEAYNCYTRFNKTICVSQGIREDFGQITDMYDTCEVLYNTVESNVILNGAREEALKIQKEEKIRLIAVGTLKEVKGFDRLLSIIKRLCRENYPIHLYILGIGPLQKDLEKYIADEQLSESITLLGYDTNPYKYVSKCDLFVCSSYSEGFSTAATESLIVGTPVCTVDVSGMKEMLGENNEWGVVTPNDEEALYLGIKQLLDEPALLKYYKEKAIERGKSFSTKETVQKVENMLMELMNF